MSNERNLAWLTEQQHKLEMRLKNKSQHLNNLSKHYQQQQNTDDDHHEPGLAFSNPIYDQLPPPKEKNGDNWKPTPAPRKINQSIRPIQSQSPDFYENDPPSFDVSDAVVSTSSFFYLEQEFPAKITKLLNEIKSVADSLGSSEPSESNINFNHFEEKIKQEFETDDAEITTTRRKRVEAKKELFKFSFSSGSEVLPPIDLSDLNILCNQNGSKSDSGLSSSGDSNGSANIIQPVVSITNESHSNHKIEYIMEPSSSPPPKLPPRKPARGNKLYSDLDTTMSNSLPPIPPNKPTSNAQITLQQSTSRTETKQLTNETKPVKPNDSETKTRPKLIALQPLNSELLSMEHLHLNKLSLQRSGYLWKTGPNYKSFKYRWCILYRYNLDLADANFSYYFNRSSISASLSGKIMISEIEFVCVCPSAPAKTKVPKLKKNEENGNTNVWDEICFLEIGVRSRQGRVYLFAARSNIDQQLWMHAFVQALSLHAFKNKELYHFGFIRAKFNVTTRWQNCFALLTADRYLYIFEMQLDNSEQMLKSINCKNYHIFNLRKTVRINRLDEKTTVQSSSTTSSPTPVSSSSSSSTVIKECRNGFSLTQNGGRVVYILTDYELHINRWYCSIMKFWQTPNQPEKMLFEEQYLTKDNIPVTVEKCLNFLDTFNVNPTVSLFTNVEQQHPAILAHCTKLLNDFRTNAWNVHLLPKEHNANQISLLLLLYLRSMNQCIFTESMLDQWLRMGELIENNDDKSSNNKENIESLKKLLKTLPIINYSTLRRLIICLANANIQYPLSTSLCKAMIFSKHKTVIVPLSAARSVLTTLITNHLPLFEVSQEEVDKEMHMKRVVHLMINQPKDQMEKHVGNNSNYHNISNMIGSSKSVSSVGGPPNTIIDTRQVNSLIIGIKTKYNNPNDSDEKTVVNVHLNRETTAQDVIDMIFNKSEIGVHQNQYCLFEVICYRRLERPINKSERVLPIVLAWSNWPSHWCAEASFEVRHCDTIMKGSLKLLHNKEKYQQLMSGSSPKTRSPQARSRTSQSVKCRPTNNQTQSYSVEQTLMSVIRYCGQNDTRIAKMILAEFSGSSLFLYCNESHQLLGQHDIDDINWYVGIENGMMVKKTTDKDNRSDGNNVTIGNNDLNIPALTLVHKRLFQTCQCKDRLNFGQTLIFSNWNELYKWIVALQSSSGKQCKSKRLVSISN